MFNFYAAKQLEITFDNGNCLYIDCTHDDNVAVVHIYNTITGERYWFGDSTKRTIISNELPDVIKAALEFIPDRTVYASDLSVY